MKGIIKRIAAIFMVSTVAMASMTAVCAPEITVKLEGEYIGFDQPPVIEEGRTLVPVRKIFEALGAEVDWSSETRTVTAKKDLKTVTLVIDSTEAKVGDKAVMLDVPARIIGGRTLVPVRFIADSFGVAVSWDGEERCVYLFKGLEDGGTGDFTSGDGGFVFE